ncbi:MAG: prephenate dehydratase [Desulfovibrionaceae bacterium]|nr:prephenate dehydratase [Desulfovibrionaceae bacterium]
MSDTLSPEQRTAALASIRHEINGVDAALLQLLNQRAALSLEVGRIKAGDSGLIFKPVREREVLASLVASNTGPLPDAHLNNIWREIFSSSRALQRPQHVAYLGPEGTFSYVAGVEYLGHAATFQPCPDLQAVFACVHSGECELGIVPLENSLQGTVGVSFDLFFSYPVFIQAELFLRISHCLLSNAQSRAAVKVVYSHSQPLAQCGQWLRTHLPNARLVPVESTAAAALRAATEPDAAAIGSHSLASMYGLDILARAVEDNPGNWTRFVIIGSHSAHDSLSSHQRTPQPGFCGANKSSVLFTLPDKAGSLAAVLMLLAEHKVNMRKLESRPMRGECWKYVFFADVECALEDPEYTDLVETLRNTCNSFRILGSYPTGPQMDRLGMDEGGV